MTVELIRARPIHQCADISVDIGLLQVYRYRRMCFIVSYNIKTVFKAGKNAWISNLKEKFVFLHIKPHNKDINDHMQRFSSMIMTNGAVRKAGAPC